MIPLADALADARKTARVFYRRCPQQHHDCILSIALEAGWKASVNYDAAKDTKHNARSYVTGRVMAALIDWWRREYGRTSPGTQAPVGNRQAGPAGSCRRRYKVVSIHQPQRKPRHLLGDSHVVLTIEDTIPASQADVDMLLDLARAWRTLDQRQAEALRDRAIGTPCLETATRWGLDQSRVSQIGKQAANQLRLALAA